MANAVDKVNGIAIASIDKINGMTDANIQALNGLEFAGVTDDMVLIEEQTIAPTTTDVGQIDFTLPTVDGSITGGTYDQFMFQFVNIHAHTGDASDANFVWQVNNIEPTADFNDIAIHASFAAAFHDEDDSTDDHGYDNTRDSPDGSGNLGTGFAILQTYQGTQADEACSGELYIWNLEAGASGAGGNGYSKPFHSIMTTNAYYDATYTAETRGVIGNTQNGNTGIDDFRFKISTGNMSGTIRLWGWKIA